MQQSVVIMAHEGVCWDNAEKGGSRDAPLETIQGPEAEAAAMVSRSKWSLCNHPLQISQEEKSPSTTSVHRNSTQLKYLKLVYCRWLG